MKENCNFLVFSMALRKQFHFPTTAVSVFMQFKLSDGHDSFTLLSKV